MNEKETKNGAEKFHKSSKLKWRNKREVWRTKGEMQTSTAALSLTIILRR